MKSLIISLCVIMSMGSFSTANAQSDKNCYETYYKSQTSECIDILLQQIQTSPKSDQTAMIGFMAEVFRADPKEKSRILEKSKADPSKLIYMAALHLADLPGQAEAYARTYGIQAEYQAFKTNNPTSLTALKPQYFPAENDFLIGAYMASGNADYIRNVLANYTSARDDMARDGFRMGLLSGKFGTNLTAPNRTENAMLKALCQKYQCRSDQQRLLRIMTMGTAYWALNSLGRNNPDIHAVVTEFFDNDPRLAKLAEEEQVAFSNYLTALVAYAVIKNDAKINTILSTYEAWKPLNLNTLLAPETDGNHE